MKSKLMTICFATVMSMLNANAMRIDDDIAEERDYNADLAAIASVRSLADFAALPDYRVERLNPAFVADVRSVFRNISALSSARTLTDLAKINTLNPELIKAAKRADICLNFNLPASLFENIEGIPANNTIGTQLMTLKKGSGQPLANDDVSKACEILYKILVTDAHITAGATAQVDSVGNYLIYFNTIFFNLSDYTTVNYLKFLSGILVAGRKAANDFSKIQADVMEEFRYNLGLMMDHATDEDLGI